MLGSKAVERRPGFAGRDVSWKMSIRPSRWPLLHCLMTVDSVGDGAGAAVPLGGSFEGKDGPGIEKLFSIRLERASWASGMMRG